MAVQFFYNDELILTLQKSAITDGTVQPSTRSEGNRVVTEDGVFAVNVVIENRPGQPLMLRGRSGDPGVTHTVEQLRALNEDSAFVMEIAAGLYTPPTSSGGDDAIVTENTVYLKRGVYFTTKGSVAGRLHEGVLIPKDAEVREAVDNAVASLFTRRYEKYITTASVTLVDEGGDHFAIARSGDHTTIIPATVKSRGNPSELHHYSDPSDGRVVIGYLDGRELGPGYEQIPNSTSLSIKNTTAGLKYHSAPVVAFSDETVQDPSSHVVRRVGSTPFLGPLTDKVRCWLMLSGWSRAEIDKTLVEKTTPEVQFDEWKVGLNHLGYALVSHERSMYIQRGILADGRELPYDDPISGESVVIRDQEWGTYVTLTGRALNHQRTGKAFKVPKGDVVVVTGVDGLPLVALDASLFNVTRASGPLTTIGGVAQFDRAAFTKAVTADLQEQLVRAGRPDAEVTAEVENRYNTQIESLTSQISRLQQQLSAAGRPDAEVEAEWQRRIEELRSRAVPEQQLRELADVLRTTADVSLTDEIAAVRELERRLAEAGNQDSSDYSPLIEYLKLKFGVQLPEAYANKLREYITGKDNRISELETELVKAGNPDAEVTAQVMSTIIDVITLQDVFSKLTDEAKRDPRQLALEISTLATNLSAESGQLIKELQAEIESLKRQSAKPNDVIPGSPLSHLLTLATGIFVGKKIL